MIIFHYLSDSEHLPSLSCNGKSKNHCCLNRSHYADKGNNGHIHRYLKRKIWHKYAT